MKASPQQKLKKKKKNPKYNYTWSNGINYYHINYNEQTSSIYYVSKLDIKRWLNQNKAIGQEG